MYICTVYSKKVYITLTKTRNHFVSMPLSVSIEVVLYVLFLPLPTGRNLNCKMDHSATDVGTEELSHIEMVCTVVYQLTRNLSVDEIKRQGFDKYFVDHTTGIYPVAASGEPWTAATIQSTGDVIADLSEDLAAEQKARKTYDNILRLSDDPDVNDVIKFLRAREVVHFQRFGEGLRFVTDKLDSKNYYACNPGFDKNCGC